MNVKVREIVAATLVAINRMQREAAGTPIRHQPALGLDFSAYAGLRVIAMNPKGYPYAA